MSNPFSALEDAEPAEGRMRHALVAFGVCMAVFLVVRPRFVRCDGEDEDAISATRLAGWSALGAIVSLTPLV